MSCIYFFGMSRGGSSICFHILQNLLADWFDKHLDKEGAAYESATDVSDLQSLYKAESEDPKANLLFGPYRKTEKAYVDSFLDVIDHNTSKVIIISRDPVDCIYSWFHAAKLHYRKEDWVNFDLEDIDNFVEKFTSHYHNDCRGLMDIAIKTDALVFDYANIVRSPVDYISKVITYLNINIPQSAINTASNLMSFINPYEEINSHRRSGIPGAARGILGKEAINQIDHVFNDFNDFFNYPAPPIPESELRLLREISSIRDSLTELMSKYSDLQNTVDLMSES